jgi:hypothetical protein
MNACYCGRCGGGEYHGARGSSLAQRLGATAGMVLVSVGCAQPTNTRATIAIIHFMARR